jgi:hypothetical protein
MFNLGLLYDEGHGVAQDYAKAREWYEKAADKGDTTAMKNLGWLYANAQGVARDYAKTREWWERRGEIDPATAAASPDRLTEIRRYRGRAGSSFPFLPRRSALIPNRTLMHGAPWL